MQQSENPLLTQPGCTVEAANAGKQNICCDSITCNRMLNYWCTWCPNFVHCFQVSLYSISASDSASVEAMVMHRKLTHASINVSPI
jgi:hypothetical protein